MSRRELLRNAVAAAGLPLAANMEIGIKPFFKTRGVVLYPHDLSLRDWPERAAMAKLTTIALHDGSAPSKVVAFIRSPAGQDFLGRCADLGLNVEYELHAMRELLPRSLYKQNPEMFRMNDEGQRTPDANLCVHSSAAFDTVAANAILIAKVLKPTTGRYFLWGDDGAAWCRCPKCRELSDSDQALSLENHLVHVLGEGDRRATLAHLAYANTIIPPSKVKPNSRVFLEFAPIHRRYDVPYAEQVGSDGLKALDANLKIFPCETAQALEYWLDMSRFSGWKRPVPEIPWRRKIFLEDLAAYAKRGVRHITTFAAWIDAEYARNHPDLSFIREYGDGLEQERGPSSYNQS